MDSSTVPIRIRGLRSGPLFILLLKHFPVGTFEFDQLLCLLASLFFPYEMLNIFVHILV